MVPAAAADDDVSAPPGRRSRPLRGRTVGTRGGGGGGTEVVETPDDSAACVGSVLVTFPSYTAQPHHRPPTDFVNSPRSETRS